MPKKIRMFRKCQKKCMNNWKFQWILVELRVFRPCQKKIQNVLKMPEKSWECQKMAENWNYNENSMGVMKNVQKMKKLFTTTRKISESLENDGRKFIILWKFRMSKKWQKIFKCGEILKNPKNISKGLEISESKWKIQNVQRLKKIFMLNKFQLKMENVLKISELIQNRDFLKNVK